MKKILFLQLQGKIFGGVWQVNRTIGEELINKGYDVRVVSLRDNHNGVEQEHDPRLGVYTINKKDIWENTYTGTEIINKIKKLKIFSVLKMVITRINHEISIKKDTKKLHEYIKDYNPNVIVTSHYELIDMIPKEYLDKTFHEQHSSFKDAIKNTGVQRTFNKYKDKVKFIWLTKKTMEDAIKYGIKENYYIYNPVRFKSDKVSNVIKNKKLITIARLSEEKRIDLMVDIVKKVFDDKHFSDWTLEIYGSGDQEDIIRKEIGDHKQIKMMGRTDDPHRELLTSSINLNTSYTEGFCLSILEANECGVPTITFDFGESVEEEVINHKTGIIAKNETDYTNKLINLMKDSNELIRLSKECKDFSKKFQIENIINEWVSLFDKIH